MYAWEPFALNELEICWDIFRKLYSRVLSKKVIDIHLAAYNSIKRNISKEVLFSRYILWHIFSETHVFLLFLISFYCHFDREKLTLFITRHPDFSPALSHSNRIKQFVMLIFINNVVPCFMHGISVRPRTSSQVLGWIVYVKMYTMLSASRVNRLKCYVWTVWQTLTKYYTAFQLQESEYNL